MEQEWLRDGGKYLNVFSGGSRGQIRPWTPSSLAITLAPSNEEINVRYWVWTGIDSSSL